MFYNLRFTTTEGDEIRFRDAVGNLIKSPAFQGKFKALICLRIQKTLFLKLGLLISILLDKSKSLILSQNSQKMLEPCTNTV